MDEIDIFYDMETGDPDDPIAVLMLACNKRVKLRGISIYPGSKDQVGFVKTMFKNIGLDDVLVGSRDPRSPLKGLQTSKIYRIFACGDFSSVEPDGLGHEILAELCAKYPRGLLISGAPLGNIYDLLTYHPEIKFDKMFVQSGFAGVNCIPIERQHPRYKGLETFRAHNFDLYLEGAWKFLNSPNIEKKYLISKDVTHFVIYDHELHKLVKKKTAEHPAWRLIWDSMEYYLKKHSRGKILHDPLAVCAAINPEIIKFQEVKCFYKNRGWGSIPIKGTNIFISVDLNYKEFLKVFLGEK
ncbi:MAG: nucleoside hydrolase [Candidatus Helarchaeota archaeon]